MVKLAIKKYRPWRPPKPKHVRGAKPEPRATAPEPRLPPDRDAAVRYGGWMRIAFCAGMLKTSVRPLAVPPWCEWDVNIVRHAYWRTLGERYGLK